MERSTEIWRKSRAKGTNFLQKMRIHIVSFQFFTTFNILRWLQVVFKGHTSVFCHTKLRLNENLDLFIAEDTPNLNISISNQLLTNS